MTCTLSSASPGVTGGADLPDWVRQVCLTCRPEGSRRPAGGGMPIVVTILSPVRIMPARSLSAQDQIIAAAGYKPETHLVTTEDGYMLKAEILTTREMLRNNI